MVSKTTIDDLRASVNRIENQIRKLERERNAITALLNLYESPSRGPSRGDGVGGRVVILRDSIRDILSEGGTLHRRDIFAKLEARGVEIGGRNPLGNVSAHLSTDERFTSVGGGYWTLVEPDAGVDDADSLDEDETLSSDDGYDSVPW